MFHHEGHIHPVHRPGDRRARARSPGAHSSGHSFGGNTSYEIVLTATDSDGIESQASVTVRPGQGRLSRSARSRPCCSLHRGRHPADDARSTSDTLIGFRHTNRHTLAAVRSASTATGSRPGRTAAPRSPRRRRPGPAAAVIHGPPSRSAEHGPARARGARTPSTRGTAGTLHDVSGNGNDGALSGPRLDRQRVPNTAARSPSTASTTWSTSPTPPRSTSRRA